MSYILEALKKSEQERNPDKVPDLSTQHQAVIAEQPKGFPWGWVISFVILANIIFWYVFLFHISTESNPTENQTTMPVVEKPEPKQEEIFRGKVVKDDTSTEPVTVVTQPETKEPQKQEQLETGLIGSSSKPPVVSKSAPENQGLQPTRVTPKTQAQLSFADLPHISELPISIQRQIPDLSFSTHIFVRDGGSFVIINNSSLSDGMSLGSGLVLESIVSEGVVLSYRNRRFTLRSMESWTAN